MTPDQRVLSCVSAAWSICGRTTVARIAGKAGVSLSRVSVPIVGPPGQFRRLLRMVNVTRQTLASQLSQSVCASRRKSKIGRPDDLPALACGVPGSDRAGGALDGAARLGKAARFGNVFSPQGKPRPTRQAQQIRELAYRTGNRIGKVETGPLGPVVISRARRPASTGAKPCAPRCSCGRRL